MTQKFSLLRLIALSFILLPPAYVLYLISQAGEIPHFDYWWIVTRFYDVNGFSSNPADWFFRNNEHLVFIPVLVYSLNILLTKGSNYGLSLFAFGFALIQSLLLIRLLPPQLKQNRFLWGLALLAISLFNFTPAAAHNWMRGFSGVIWMSANLFVVTALFCFTQVAQKPKLSWVIGSIAGGLLAALSYSTSLALWGVFCILSVLCRFPKRLIFTYWTVSLAVVSTYFLTYKTPPHHPSLSRISPLEALEYIPTYLGGIFTIDVDFALVLGLFGLMGAAIAFRYLVIQNSASIIPWISLILYTFGTALMAAVSRSGFGLEQAFSSRYASLPALFWLGLTLIALTWLAQRFKNRQPWFKLIPWFTVTLILVSSMYRVGYEVFSQQILPRAQLQPLIALSLGLDAPDPDLVKAVIGNRPEAFLKMAPALKANGLVPFTYNLFADNPCTPLGIQIPTNQIQTTTQNPVSGYFDHLSRFPEFTGELGTIKVNGWATAPEPIHCIAILNQDRVVRGFGLVGFPRPDVAQTLGIPQEFTGWQGYAQVTPIDHQVTAYAIVGDRRSWVPLRGQFNPSP